MSEEKRIGNRGGFLHLDIRVGSTLEPRIVSVLRVNNIPYIMTGATFKAAIRRNYNAETLPDVTFEFEVVSDTEFKFWLPASSSQNLGWGADDKDPKSQYVWNLDAILADGTILPVLYGTVTTYGRATQ